jgi:hypothetical protein
LLRNDLYVAELARHLAERVAVARPELAQAVVARERLATATLPTSQSSMWISTRASMSHCSSSLWNASANLSATSLHTVSPLARLLDEGIAYPCEVAVNPHPGVGSGAWELFDLDPFNGVARFAVALRVPLPDLADHVHAAYDLTKDRVPVVQPGRCYMRDEEL